MTNGDVTTNELLEFLQENMVTKEDLTKGLNTLELKMLDAMDDKLSDLKGDLVILMRKEDRKLTSLISLLLDKKVISKEEASALFGLEPFPQL